MIASSAAHFKVSEFHWQIVVFFLTEKYKKVTLNNREQLSADVGKVIFVNYSGYST